MAEERETGERGRVPARRQDIRPDYETKDERPDRAPDAKTGKPEANSSLDSESGETR